MRSYQFVPDPRELLIDCLDRVGYSKPVHLIRSLKQFEPTYARRTFEGNRRLLFNTAANALIIWIGDFAYDPTFKRAYADQTYMVISMHPEAPIVTFYPSEQQTPILHYDPTSAFGKLWGNILASPYIMGEEYPGG